MTRVFSRCGPAANANGAGIPERVRQIIHEVAAQHGLTMADLIGPARQKIPSRARFAAYAVIRERVMIKGVPASYPQIGKWFGNRDHTSVLHGVKVALSGGCEPPEITVLPEPVSIGFAMANQRDPVQNQRAAGALERSDRTVATT